MKKIIQNDFPFFDMTNAYDLFKKLEYDYLQLSKSNNEIYSYMNFIITAKHLFDWIINDSNFNRQIKNKCIVYIYIGL